MMRPPSIGLTRRRVLQTGMCAGVASCIGLGAAGQDGPLATTVQSLPPGLDHEDIIAYVHRMAGGWDVESKVDHNITRVVSGIAHTALEPSLGAQAAARILRTLV